MVGPTVKIVVFFAATVVLAFVSRLSLRAPRSHGLYRFFAWEAMLGVILLNVDVWFRDPLSMRQLVSWSLLLTSILLAVHGFHLLRQIGRPDETIEDPTLLAIEKTTRLVTSGAYRYIRHPLYASLLCLAWGAYLKRLTLPSSLLVLAATAALYATARMEERENLQKFGQLYADYMRGTRMFIPGLL